MRCQALAAAAAASTTVAKQASAISEWTRKMDHFYRAACNADAV